jgi:hypothetical protein
MEALHLTAQEFLRIVRACQRVVINPSTLPFDLRRFLVTRLAEVDSALAERVEHYDDVQMAELRQEVLTALQGDSQSVLWQPASRMSTTRTQLR